MNSNYAANYILQFWYCPWFTILGVAQKAVMPEAYVFRVTSFAQVVEMGLIVLDYLNDK